MFILCTKSIVQKKIFKNQNLLTIHIQFLGMREWETTEIRFPTYQEKEILNYSKNKVTISNSSLKKV